MEGSLQGCVDVRSVELGRVKHWQVVTHLACVEPELCRWADHPEPCHREARRRRKVCVFTYATINVLADVSGFFSAGSGFTPIQDPTRVLDTRNGIGA